MPEKLCQTCQAWLCAGDDAFCGACGSPCAALRLEAWPAVLLIGHQPPDLIFKLFNASCATLAVCRTDAPAWLAWSQRPEGTVPAHGMAVYRASAATRTLTAAAAGTVSVETTGGTVSALLLAVNENPVLLPSVPEVEFWTDGPHANRQIALTAIPAAGSLRISGLHDDPERSWLHVFPLASPVLASAEHPLAFTVEIDPARFAQAPADGSQNQRRARIAVDYDGPHGGARAPLELLFTVRHRPELFWDGENALPTRKVAMARQNLALRFYNKSRAGGGLLNAPLHIEEVHLQPPQDVACAIRRQSLLPVDVPGGDPTNVLFDLDLAGVAPGLHHFQLQVRSNGPETTRTWDAVPLLVDPVIQFDGILAIDFGTSNTCCAMLETGGDVEDVPLDEERLTCPTLVRYLDLSHAVPEIETGITVKRMAAADSAVAASKLDRLKQMLGEPTHLLSVRPKNSAYFVQREARDAAADYLRHLREVAEWTRHAVFPKIVLTHPAVCSLRQYRNLRLAVEDAFGKTEIDFMQEPLAALIPFFAQMAAVADSPSYTVAAFDLGGGTTDITLVHVHHQRDETGKLEIRPEIVTSWGERFGGEDLTDLLMRELTARATRIIETDRHDYKLAARQVKGSSDPDFMRNEAALRDAAERLKASLSEEQGAAREPFEGLRLRVIPPDPNRPAEDFTIDAARLSQQGQVALDAYFLAELRSSICRLALRLRDSAAALPSLDHIHLSGKTTFLPLVMEVFQQSFTAQIHRAGDPKECVVRGACLARAMSRRGRSKRLVLPPGQRRTTSSIGLMQDDNDFVSVIPLDCTIPDQGLRREQATWSGDGRVVLWENLGFENQRVRPDGTRNSLIEKLGTWEPDGVPGLPPDTQCTLRLELSADFTLTAAMIASDNRVVPLRQRDAY